MFRLSAPNGCCVIENGNKPGQTTAAVPAAASPTLTLSDWLAEALRGSSPALRPQDASSVVAGGTFRPKLKMPLSLARLSYLANKYQPSRAKRGALVRIRGGCVMT